MDLDGLEREAFGERFDRALIAHRLFVTGISAKDAFQRLRCCVVLKEMGHVDNAYHMMRAKLSAVRLHADSVREYALVCRRLSRDDEADAELARLLRRHEPTNATVRDIIFRAYFDLRTSPHRARVLRRGLRQRRQRGCASDSDVLEDFAGRVAPFLRDAVALYRDKRFASPYEVAGAVIAAMSDQRPFALVRLGDGEGALLAPERMADLFREHRAHFLRRWYGTPELADDPTFLALASKLSDRLEEVDILGIPERTWLLYERDHGNVRTFMCCLALVLTSGPYARDKLVCNTSVHIDLAYRHLLDGIIRMAPRIILVTSHADLALRLAAHLDVPPIETLLIPPAHSDLSETGYAAGLSHIDDAYAPTMAALAERAGPGTLVLVGAGFLGKLYCLEAKRSGAVALDLGSVVDLWMGYRTRPNFEGLENLTLPQFATEDSPGEES